MRRKSPNSSVSIYISGRQITARCQPDKMAPRKMDVQSAEAGRQEWKPTGSCSQSFFAELTFKCSGREVSQSSLFALLPVNYFYIFSDGLNGLGTGFKTPVVRQFTFEQPPKAFHRRITLVSTFFSLPHNHKIAK